MVARVVYRTIVRRLRLLLLAVGGFALSACLGALGPGSGRIPSLVGDRRVLFVGNSHTYANDLPQMLQELARLAGDTALRTAAIAYANFALEDHYYLGDAPKALERSGWEFVVMQQGTSAAAASQAHLAYWSAQFDPLIRAAGAEPVLYQIWPLASQRSLAADALKSYHNAAVEVGGILAPAGDAFTAALEEDAGVGVYAADGLHASPRGTYLAALVLLSRLTDVAPGSLPPAIPGFPEDTSVVRLLQRAAGVALERTPARPTVAMP